MKLCVDNHFGRKSTLDEYGIMVLAEPICTAAGPASHEISHFRYYSQTHDVGVHKRHAFASSRGARSLEAPDSLNPTWIPGLVRRHRQSMAIPGMQLGLPVQIAWEKKFMNPL